MGMWKSGIDRVKSGDKRLEEMTPFERYFKDIEWVDMGNPDVLYALNDFPLNYENSFSELLSIDEINNIKLPDDVSIITKANIKWLKDNCDVGLTKFGQKMVGCMSKINGRQIFFNLYNTDEDPIAIYFLKHMSDEARIMLTKVGPNNFPSYLGTVTEVPVYTQKFDEKKYTIKLVKEKWL